MPDYLRLWSALVSRDWSIIPMAIRQSVFVYHIDTFCTSLKRHLLRKRICKTCRVSDFASTETDKPHPQSPPLSDPFYNFPLLRVLLVLAHRLWC